jgi:methyltransferase
VTLQRLAELWLSTSNTRRLKAMGAVEAGAEHYPVIVLLHAAWLAGLWALGYDQTVVLFWLCLFAGLQVMRLWVILTLGPRWTTRIIVLPGAPLVTDGPFRFITHPNYCIVAVEIMALPFCLGLFWYGLAFGLVNVFILRHRVRVEERALGFVNR